jgi:hypothetical protein
MTVEGTQLTAGRRIPQPDGIVITPAGDDLPIRTEGNRLYIKLMAGLHDKLWFLREAHGRNTYHPAN